MELKGAWPAVGERVSVRGIAATVVDVLVSGRISIRTEDGKVDLVDPGQVSSISGLKDPPWPFEDDKVGECERCDRRSAVLDPVKFHGYSLWLCRKCGLAALQSGEAVD